MPSLEQTIDAQSGTCARGDPPTFASPCESAAICSDLPFARVLAQDLGVIERKLGERFDRGPAIPSHGNRVTSGRSALDNEGASVGEGPSARFVTFAIDGGEWRSRVWPLGDKVEEPVWW